MSKGCLIFAHDGTLDYGSQAVLAAKLVIKHLGVPVTLVTDKATIKNLEKKFSKLPFESIVKIDKPKTKNKRLLTDYSAIAANRDGKLELAKFKEKLVMHKLPEEQLEYFSQVEKLIVPQPVKETVDFINDSRSLAYELSPYDRTLVIDSDFLVFSNRLNQFWEHYQDFLISPGMLDIQAHDIDPKKYQINPYTIDMLWATTFMFSKTKETEIFFNLLKAIQKEYEYFAHLYEFDPVQYRNDFSFSIASHILGGHGVDKWHGELPVPLMLSDADRIVAIKENEITFLLKDAAQEDDYLLFKTSKQDLHVMNKRDIIANFDQLLEMAN